MDESSRGPAEATGRLNSAPILMLTWALAVTLSGALGCGEEARSGSNNVPQAPGQVAQGPILLVDRAAESGLAFVHRSGARGNFSYPEILSGGVCLADLDGDGDLDVYLPQGGPVPGDPGEPGRNSLFLNDGSGMFRDVSAASGADHPGYGMGAFAADVDQDGDQDLLLTNVGSLALLRNHGDATFEEMTSFAGLEGRDGFWFNAAFADLDRDGKLDLYVANYTDWRPGVDPDCTGPGGRRDYCNPSSYPGAQDLLLFGRGDGRFEDRTGASGIGAAATRSMGVVIFDAEPDGDLDLYVANDGESNLLWINQGDRTFRDEALIRGVALDGGGAPQASMGIVCADPDGDGDEDLILTHLERETHTFYRNDEGFFDDASASLGLSRWSRPDTGFGVGLLDLDHDRHLDLFVANGGVVWPTRTTNADDPYAQPDRTVRGAPGGLLATALTVGADGASGGANTAATSRGAAFGDLDGDGLVDVVVAVRDGPVRLLRNETRTDGHWIGFHLVAPATAVLSASVRVEQAPELGLGVVRPHASYLGSSEELVRFGLGSHREPVDVLVTWATGDRERFEGLATDRIHALRKGAGRSAQPAQPAQPARPSQPLPAATDPATGQAPAGDRSDRPPSSEERRQDPDAVAAGGDGQALPFPPLQIEREGDRGQRAVLDTAALAAWCERIGLPPPPALGDLDAPTWKLVHPAIEAAGRTPSPGTLGSLAMYYHGQNAGESARALYERLVKLEPEDARWWHLLGRVTFDLGDPGRSILALERAVELSPTEPAGFARLADSQLAAGHARAASNAWKQYLELRPRDPVGLIGRARAAEGLDRLEEALEFAESALALRPDARPALVLAARVSARLGRLERAKLFGRRAAALTKDDAPGLVDDVDLAMRAHSRSVAYLRVAANHFKQAGRFQEAFEVTRLLAERRPDEAQIWQLLTWLSVVLRRGDEALEFARTALEIDPEFAPGWELVSRGRLAAGEIASALEAADRAVSIDPSHAPAHLTRGLVLGKLRRCEEALLALETGLASTPDDIEGLATKAACQLSLGRRQEARQTLDRILELSPEHPWATRVRSKL